MAVSQISRRKLLISGFMAWAGVWLPAGDLPAAQTPVWLAPLFRNLADLSTWMRTEYDEKGNVVVHCGTRDFSAWARHAGALAGREQKVLARGNSLTFRLSGKQVRIVIHPDIA